VCSDVIDVFDPAHRARLAAYARGAAPAPASGFWSIDELAADIAAST
jgi:hypothetical protein